MPTCPKCHCGELIEIDKKFHCLNCDYECSKAAASLLKNTKHVHYKESYIDSSKYNNYKPAGNGSSEERPTVIKPTVNRTTYNYNRTPQNNSGCVKAFVIIFIIVVFIIIISNVLISSVFNNILNGSSISDKIDEFFDGFSESSYSYSYSDSYNDDVYTDSAYPDFESDEYGNIYANTENDSINEALQIPDEISGIEIDAIGYEGFLDRTNIKSVVLTEDIFYIAYSAFQGCTSLREINLEDVYSVGDNAFENTALEQITFNSNVELYTEAFKDCKNLTNVYFNAVPYDIDSTAFDGCDNLQNIYFSGTEEEWKDFDEDGDFHSKYDSIVKFK